MIIIWWKSNGLWAGFWLLVMIYFPGKLGEAVFGRLGGDIGVAIGLATYAGLIFLFRKSIGKESSLYSVPVRFCLAARYGSFLNRY
ncbi:hypothetical protein FACS1894185_3260 [Betaproteobacteria bacterium]|nr:hypothetical protein FACS1894185_3260 [Betaproteobacteria bacterium]